MKKISPYWALLVGLLSIVAQIITFYVRFGRFNTDATLAQFLFFYLSGALGGWILISFLNRQASTRARWVVLVAFLIASPVALFLMLVGGLLGPIGVLIFPQIPWALFTWIGALVARFVI